MHSLVLVFGIYSSISKMCAQWLEGWWSDLYKSWSLISKKTTPKKKKKKKKTMSKGIKENTRSQWIRKSVNQSLAHTCDQNVRLLTKLIASAGIEWSSSAVVIVGELIRFLVPCGSWLWLGLFRSFLFVQRIRLTFLKMFFDRFAGLALVVATIGVLALANPTSKNSSCIPLGPAPVEWLIASSSCCWSRLLIRRTSGRCRLASLIARGNFRFALRMAFFRMLIHRMYSSPVACRIGMLPIEETLVFISP